MSQNSFDARSTLEVGGTSYEIFRLDAVEGSARLPFSLKVLLENLLRTEDGANVTAEQIRALGAWQPDAEPDTEIQYTPARVLMQDFTGVPCVVDLAAMREAVAALGGDATKINPLSPAELVIDHSVIADVFGTSDAFRRNAEVEFERNEERYQFLRWGQTAFDDFAVVPPDTGIVHQVNLEHLAKVVYTRTVRRHPAGLPRHPGRHRQPHHHDQRPGRARLGRRRHRGRGGHARPAGEHADPQGRRLQALRRAARGRRPPPTWCSPSPTCCAEHGVVGKFVEFYGPGVTAVPLANRATIGNMSPEYGSTCAIFPVDAETLRYLRLTGRSDEQVALVEAYAKTQGMWHDPDAEPEYSETALPRRLHRGAEHRRAQAPPGPRAALRGQGGLPGRPGRLRRRGRRRAPRPPPPWTRPPRSPSRPATPPR